MGQFNCTEPPEAVAEYQEVVRQTLQRITGGRTEVSYPLLIQREIILQLMVDLDHSGYCSTYDLSAGNAEAQASEMGVCLGVGGDHCSWFQPISSAGYIRWDGMFRSKCYPVAHVNMVAEVAAFWGLPVPPPFGPGPLQQSRRNGRLR